MKRFVIKTIVMVIPVICVIFYYKIAIEPHMNGDLGRLGFIAFDDDYEAVVSPIATDSVFVIDIDNLSQLVCDSAILTVGDSFSRQGAGGYQNCLASFYPGWKIFNYSPKYYSGDNHQDIIDMLLEDKPLPQIVIIESVERNMTKRLSDLCFYGKANVNDFEKSVGLSAKQTDIAADNSHFNNYYLEMTITLNKVRSSILKTQEFVKKNLDIDNPVKRLQLKQNLFTCNGSETELYFYHEDLYEMTQKDYEEGRLKLDSLLAIIEKKNIKFVYLVASDKYDLYKDFSINDPYKATGQLIHYEVFNKNNRFLNTKELLYNHIKEGEQDIYKCNDSHWSAKTSLYVAKEIKRRLDLQGNYDE